ncbi:MAG: hypothetical protein B7Z77_04170 [Acidocella sp. 20-58-15]|nr:MAG: hypothetical protein B7Z77_04170 [Acidocella sp. 20-58-15]
MRRLKFVAATALGIIIGGILFNALPAYADLPVIDPASILKEVQEINVLGDIENGLNSLLGKSGPIATLMGDNTYGTVQQLLQEGFTQDANYSKASIGAMENITDASNEAMAQYDLQLRDAQIRDEQTASPTACTDLDNGVSTQAAAIQGDDVGFTIGQIEDVRDESGPNTPSYYGQAQGVASESAEHLNYYCDQNDVSAGLCANSTTATADADQRFSSLFGSGTYANQTAVTTAKDYAINLIEPVAPAALRGDQLNSIAGQDAAVQRRSYNARMSLAQNVIDNIIGMQSPSVPLTSQQQTYLTNMGFPQQTNGSWLQVLQINAESRVSDINWNAQLQNMPPAAVSREVALELALNNYLQFQIFKIDLQIAAVDATNLAQNAQHDFQPAVPMPTPNIN